MDRLVTIFGGGGFVGRYIVRELLKDGFRVRIAERNPKDAFFLQTAGGLGEIQFVSADVTKPESVARAVAGAGAVVNLVGILKGDFARVHVDGARIVAEAAARAGAGAFLHISAIGADPASASAYGRSKGEGEAAVRAAFPAATILRPSVIFGPEDGFLNRFAGMIRMAPVLPIVRPEVRFQPVYVGDVARATAAAIGDPAAYGGRTYELGGPEQLSMAALNRWIADETGRSPLIVPLPDVVGAAMARLTGWLPGAPITQDQWLMLQKDNVVADGAQGLAALSIEPTPMAAVAPSWLVRYRKHGRFGRTTKAV